MSHSKSARERKLGALRKRGWGEAKIQRWLHEQDVVAAREERSAAPPSVWANEMSAEVEKQLMAKYRDFAIFAEPEWFDHQTALALIDDAEAAGLVTLVLEFAHVRGDRKRLMEGAYWWTKEAEDSYTRGGRDAVVRATAQATRDLIQDGFPNEADLILFYFE